MDTSYAKNGLNGDKIVRIVYSLDTIRFYGRGKAGLK